MAVIWIVGDGQLADHVSQKLSIYHEAIRHEDLSSGIPGAVDLALVLHDTWIPSMHYQAEELFNSIGLPWLRGFVCFGEGIIGPLIRPGTPGCTQCADMRRTMAGRDRNEMRKIERMLSEREQMERDIWSSRTGIFQLSHLLVAETEKALNSECVHGGSMIFLNLKTLKSSRHFVLPDPLCSVCGDLPDDSPEAAKLVLKASPKINNKVYRTRPLYELKNVLEKEYVDYKTGIFNAKMHDLVSPFADASVVLPLYMGDEVTGGRTHSYADSDLTAILEGLERYSGTEARGKRTIVRDSYRNLSENALNPVSVGLHTPKQYAMHGFPFKSFDPDRPIGWVWGYSFLKERPILVPELLAYYSLGTRHDNDGGFVYETSNGCALGGSLEEAIFYGIMEVIERDSFLLTWYAQMPIPRLDPYSANDKEMNLMIDRIRTVAGYDVHLFNATMEHGIPSVWAIAKNRKSKGLNLVCAAGAHLDPIRAAKGSIQEIASMLMTLEDKFEQSKEEYVRMYHDPWTVKEMEDHSMLYGLPQAQHRLSFLLDNNRPSKTFGDEFKPRKWKEDLTDDLKDILQTFRQLNLDVIVVDQSTPEITRNGLHCVKVLIPGMLPITFGYHLTRLEGLDRVYNVPVQLGYAKMPLTRNQLNPHPHPFP